MSHFKFQEIGYCLGVVALFFYSFTQIDLSLTLSRASWMQQFEKAFQYIGYFNRPLSTYLFVGILLILYILFLKIFLSAKQLSYKKIWGIVLFSTILLGLAYNAFSYDLFNYIFDAKIITHYHLSPYDHKALDFPGEPMLSFMHWTHRVYPYGPVWLALTVPLSYMGLNFFLPTFFLFKACIAASFLGTVWLISQIMKKTAPLYEKQSIVFFALNPFVLIESLVSAHIDIVMMFFVMLGVYFLVQKKYVLVFLALLLAYGIKFASAEFSLPIHAGVIISLAVGLIVFTKIQKKLPWEMWFLIFSGVMVIPVVFASLRTSFQPWYLLSILPFASLLTKRFISIPVSIISLFALFEYVPYLYLGNWDPPVPTYLLDIRLTGVGIAFLASILIFLFVKKSKNDTI